MVEHSWWEDDDVSDVADAFEAGRADGVPVQDYDNEEERGTDDALGIVIGVSAAIIVLLSVAVVMLWASSLASLLQSSCCLVWPL